MNYESYFIKNFIVRSRQERLQYELQSMKKRQYGIGRFCHYAEDWLDMSKICKTEDFAILKENPECYVIAYQPELDKLQCSLKHALELVLGNGMAAVIVGVGFAVVETEQVQGTPVRYFLKLS
ncbi:MAG: hypothetical protein K2H82_09165 [Oscillospiraceae bacterium]|nr:hypothetical protein [Oscillospiraceae bacterium]